MPLKINTKAHTDEEGGGASVDAVGFAYCVARAVICYGFQGMDVTHIDVAMQHAIVIFQRHLWHQDKTNIFLSLARGIVGLNRLDSCGLGV